MTSTHPPTQPPAIPTFTATRAATLGGAIARAIGALVGVGAGALGVLAACASWLIAAFCFDGSTLFGCSDGTKTPDPAAGLMFIGIGAAAAFLGLWISVCVFRTISRTGD